MSYDKVMESMLENPKRKELILKNVRASQVINNLQTIKLFKNLYLFGGDEGSRERDLICYFTLQMPSKAQVEPGLT